MYPICAQISRSCVVPSMAMLPRVAGDNPASARNNVVFPAPLSPRIEYRRPTWKLAFTPRSAENRPNCLIRPAMTMTESTGAAAVGIGITVIRKDNQHRNRSTSWPLDETDTNLINCETICDLPLAVVVLGGHNVHTGSFLDPGVGGSLVVVVGGRRGSGIGGRGCRTVGV